MFSVRCSMFPPLSRRRNQTHKTKMKYKLTFALVASLTSTAFGAFQAPLPEFKNEKQLADWRAEKACEVTRQGYAAEVTPFYTGKPYLASSSNYAFKYRSYNPEVARWTSEDPSGFPDGANGSYYAPRPTTQLDALGLDAVSFTGTPTASTLSGSNFNITVITAAQRIGQTIAAEMEVGWAIGSSLSGWVVQHIQLTENVFNDNGTPWTAPGPLTSQYWEAWRVNGGVVEVTSTINGKDYFGTRTYDPSTNGSFNFTGKVDFYSDSVFTGSHTSADWGNSPGSWSTNAVPEAGGLHARLTEPNWWTGTGFNHNLTLSWE